MTNLLIKQFQLMKSQEYIYLLYAAFGSKTEQVLNRAIPNLKQNLQSSAKAYIEALLNLDSAFIQQTSTPQLQKIILPQIKELRTKHVKIRSYTEKRNLSDNQQKFYRLISKRQTRNILIAPYVIFGQTMQDRLKRTQLSSPIELPLFLSSNRYVVASSVFNLQKMINEQVYGFTVCLLNMNKAIEVNQGKNIIKYAPRQFFLRFQTDAINHQFYVANFNYLVAD